MNKEIFKEFDGYQELVAESNYSRKYSHGYNTSMDTAERYIQRLHPATLRLRVTEMEDLTETVKRFRLVSEDGYLPPFLAGQYIALHVQVGAVRTSRPYSICSPPNQTGYYDLAVRRVEGGLVSNYLLDEVKPGQRISSSGPAGHFYFNPLFHDRTQVLVAGGSGVTPFYSMIREVVDCGLDREIHLFYGNRSIEEAIFHDDLAAMARAQANIHYHPVIENPPDDYQGLTGYMSAQVIGSALDNLNNKTFYLCGPQAMYDFCLPELDTLNVPGRKIRREVYGAPLNVCQSDGWPETLAGDAVFKVNVRGGNTVDAPAGRPLLESLEKGGVVPPSICRSGECSMCRVKVLSGTVYQPPAALVRKADRNHGYVHACVSYPLEDLEIML